MSLFQIYAKKGESFREGLESIGIPAASELVLDSERFTKGAQYMPGDKQNLPGVQLDMVPKRLK
jgi:hypothetical protein